MKMFLGITVCFWHQPAVMHCSDEVQTQLDFGQHDSVNPPLRLRFNFNNFKGDHITHWLHFDLNNFNAPINII